MPASFAWGYYPTDGTWKPIVVNVDGKLVIDPSEVTLDKLGDVEVPTPADGDFVYWDAATSLWKPKAHAALTTGVHGVGALHAAGFHSAGQAVSKVIWKDASENALTDLNRTGTLAWTDLDLTAYTSANAKFAILRLKLWVDSIGADGWAHLYVRKNGTTPDAFPDCVVSAYLAHVANSEAYCFPIIGLDAGQVCEYEILMGGTIQVDSYIDVLGYIE